MLGDFEVGTVPMKMADTKLYVRATPEGRLQLIRVEPFYNDIGILIPISVMMYVDNDEGVLMDRMVAEMLCEAYTPLERITKGKGGAS